MFRPALAPLRASARGFASAAAPGSNEFMANRAATKVHASETTDLWRKISLYVCVPGILVGALWTYKVEEGHAEHLAHLAEENGGEMPDRSVYSYMNIRGRPFPWGKQTAFFNPKVNIPAE
ncbi:cytochrome c oxidase subunit 6a, partial [Tremellales sp. Uapishka_1]